MGLLCRIPALGEGLARQRISVDDRVVLGRTFEYVAALQAADIGPKPKLVRIETRAGRGAGMPLDKVIVPPHR
jgi:hypothetical protein